MMKANHDRQRGGVRDRLFSTYLKHESKPQDEAACFSYLHQFLLRIIITITATRTGTGNSQGHGHGRKHITYSTVHYSTYLVLTRSER